MAPFSFSVTAAEFRWGSGVKDIPFTSLVLLNTMEAVVGHSGVQLAPDKIEGPTTVVTFLGIVINLV